MFRKKYLYLVLATLLLVACGQAPQIVVATQSSDEISTIVANELALRSTVQAIETAFAELTQAAEITPTASPLPTEAEPSATSEPLPTEAEATATTIVLPSVTPVVVQCNAAQFVSDISVQDESIFERKDEFVKTWRIKNVGSCTWDSGYTIRYASGTNLASAASYKLPKTVAPGETVDLSIKMTVPNSLGHFESRWMLQSGSGDSFGIGLSAKLPIFVIINVIAKANPSFDYDFAANVCKAEWRNSIGTIPCPGVSSSASSGFVILLNEANLESGLSKNLTIWTHPNHLAGGYVQGLYPAIRIEKDQRFVTELGCLKENKGCSVRFRLDYINSNGKIVNLGVWAEVLDGGVREIDIDLASLEGKSVRFIFTMEARTSNFTAANGYWHEPSLR